MEMAIGGLMMLNSTSSNLSTRAINTKGHDFKSMINEKIAAGELNLSSDSELITSFRQALESILEKLMQGDQSLDQDAKQLIESLRELSQVLGDELPNELTNLVSQISEEFSDYNTDQIFELVGMVLLQNINQPKTNNQFDPSRSINQGDLKLLAQILNLSNTLNNGKSSHQIQNSLPKNWSNQWNELVSHITNHKSGQLNHSSTLSNQLVKAVQDLVVQPKQSAHEYKLQIPRNPHLQADGSKVVAANQGHLSQQEQLVIHMSRPQQSTSTNSSQPLIEQLQKIIQSTRFNQIGGQKQLSIQLKPANLGDMVVKFTQMDGQMAVKISVTTQAAKEMLESNIQQLRHMFSPNQVVIERQVDSTQTDENHAFLNQDDDSSKSGEGSEQDEQNQSDSNDEHNEKSFKDYLFEEEV